MPCHAHPVRACSIYGADPSNLIGPQGGLQGSHRKELFASSDICTATVLGLVDKGQPLLWLHHNDTWRTDDTTVQNGLVDAMEQQSIFGIWPCSHVNAPHFASNPKPGLVLVVLVTQAKWAYNTPYMTAT
ncbi:hypothetical protein M431DRAFT_482015 [Trichoderma harzianum CBS 226.95]|uniref:Uncharacterized protein n=1 Tax=Trichoderma harzianum CBS 226.95 TaxID=983964 RepID=A0A2T4ACT5_TRIHA|nr:hypothetical protein M431DRAFT_482015 [Trichoderma harzianum CBS 226.95]PTB54823.1 hypothetical protein M431DRAFT_482015 [Trichoderma harzianum CBS 226.95]